MTKLGAKIIGLAPDSAAAGKSRRLRTFIDLFFVRQRRLFFLLFVKMDVSVRCTERKIGLDFDLSYQQSLVGYTRSHFITIVKDDGAKA